MRVLTLSPYHGGSHQAWAEGYGRHSRHEVRLLTLPARFWKWRMHGGGVTLARRFGEALRPAGAVVPDVLLVTDMLDLTTFLALVRRQCVDIPVALYMHENQLTYPLPADHRSGPMRRQHGERDLHYVFINYASMLVADRILFNSQFHLQSLFEALPRFLKHFPEYNEQGSVLSLREKSIVLPVGLELGDLAATETETEGPLREPNASSGPLILWNQRWEYDKNPEAFFRALYCLKDEGAPFRLALCGERFSQSPDEFDEARRALEANIVHAGYAEPESYRRLLWSADIVVSTAVHEFFGISVLEAIYCQTFPILPNRLSYPELLPEAFHDSCLYKDDEGLLSRLRGALQDPEETRELAARIAPAVERFAWSRLAPRYDTLLEELVKEVNQQRF